MFQRDQLSKKTILMQFLLFIVISIVSFCLLSLIGFVLIPFLFSISFVDLTSVLANYSNPKAVLIFKFLQMNQALGLFIIPPMLFSYWYSNNIMDFLQLRFPKNKRYFFMGILGLFIISPFISHIAQWNASMQLPESMKAIESWMKSSEAEATKLTELFLNIHTVSALMVNMLVIALAAAIGEEFFFRGILQKLIYNASKNVHLSVWLIAIVFSAIHGQFYGFLPRMFLGAFLGYAYFYSGSIWVSVVIHFVNNGLAVSADYLFRNKIISFNLDDSIPIPLYLAISSFALGIFVFSWMRKNSLSA